MIKHKNDRSITSRAMKQKTTSTILLGMLAVVLVPVGAGAASSTANTTVNATLASTITVTSSGTVNLAINPVTGGSQTTASDTVSVSTNNAAGYQLRLANTDTTLTLVNGGNTIAAHTGTYGTPTALANNTWGYRVDVGGTVGAGAGFGAGPTSASTDQATNAATFAGVPSSASPQTIRNTATTATSEVTTVWFSAKADTTKANGTYTDSVTYTAVTN